MATTASQNSTEELPSSTVTGKHSACHRPNNATPSEDREDRQPPTVAVDAQPSELRMWRKPWIVALVLFFLFFFLWAFAVVVKRYWIDEKWEVALPGLNTSVFRKHTMRLHLTFGALGILCSPIQIITPFTSGWKQKGESTTRNNWYRQLHRYSGTLSVVCAVLSYICGQWFIILKQFLLVGGYNMGIAFSLAGFAIAYFAYMTWKTAPRKNTKSVYTIEEHRNCAIRCFSQMIAPLLYRYWYLLIGMILKLYRTPYLNSGDPRGEKLVCDDRNVCTDYERPFDAVWCWLYWTSALAVAEAVIFCLPNHHQARTVATVKNPGNELTAPFLQAQQATEDEAARVTDTNDKRNSKNGRTQSENLAAQAITNRKVNRRKMLLLNFLGCLLATLTAMVSGPIIIMIVMSVFGMTEKKSSSAAVDV